ncbi:hypothetical protein PMAYCL1PPCAC_15533 [Pristionchus mayeri]|uniref:G protein-coupled receptor n=1 Tax=Pristionchus mayeri TaxID=1317129 RepID=A0AAN5CJ53_9BILA|nr:hypothetical protein PMAYCL1PPCAC_15533 [Pristionchus mayeri]
MELLTALAYNKSLKQNESIQHSDGALTMSLSERYQLKENIRVLRVLLPIVKVGYFIYEVAGIQKEYYPMFEVIRDFNTVLTNLQDTINVIYLQGITMPLVFFIRHKLVQTHQRLIENQIFTANMASGFELVAAHDLAITIGW